MPVLVYMWKITCWININSSVSWTTVAPVNVINLYFSTENINAKFQAYSYVYSASPPTFAFNNFTIEHVNKISLCYVLYTVMRVMAFHFIIILIMYPMYIYTYDYFYLECVIIFAYVCNNMRIYYIIQNTLDDNCIILHALWQDTFLSVSCGPTGPQPTLRRVGIRFKT